MVKAVFYCLNFGGELDEDFDFEAFCECFDDRMIEPIGFLHDPDAIMVGNEEAKLIGMAALSACGGKRCNRRFIEGIVAGPFFICGDDGEDFCSLTDEQCEEYVQLFSQPHEITPEEVKLDMRIDLIGF